MSSKAKMNIFTGGKGGVGKTLLCLSASAHFLQRNNKTLLVDLNIFNPDLFSILINLAEDEDRKRLRAEMNRRPDRKQDHYREDGFVVVEIDKNGLLVMPDFCEFKHYELPIGISGFYDDSLNRIFNLSKVRSLKPEICLVDTGFHIANLAVFDGECSETSWLGKNPNNKEALPNLLNENDLIIWFLWTLGSWERENELEAIETAVDRIECLEVGQFAGNSSMIHAFNPYYLLPEPGLLEFLFRTRHPLREMTNDDNFGADVSLNFMTRTIARKIYETQRKGHLDRETYPRIIGDAILKNGAGMRPKNFFPFMTSPQLRNYLVDLTSESQPKNLRAIIEFLGDTHSTMERYLLKYMS